jgi:hypothetical protein
MPTYNAVVLPVYGITPLPVPLADVVVKVAAATLPGIEVAVPALYHCAVVMSHVKAAAAPVPMFAPLVSRKMFAPRASRGAVTRMAAAANRLAREIKERLRFRIGQSD